MFHENKENVINFWAIIIALLLFCGMPFWTDCNQRGGGRGAKCEDLEPVSVTWHPSCVNHVFLLFICRSVCNEMCSFVSVLSTIYHAKTTAPCKRKCRTSTSSHLKLYCFWSSVNRRSCSSNSDCKVCFLRGLKIENIFIIIIMILITIITVATIILTLMSRIASNKINVRFW